MVGAQHAAPLLFSVHIPPACHTRRHGRPETIAAPVRRPRHGRGDHGGVGDLPHPRARGRPARSPLAHVRRLGAGGRPGVSGRALLRRARHAPPQGRRQVRVRAPGVRAARRVRGGLGGKRRDVHGGDRRDRRRGGRVPGAAHRLGHGIASVARRRPGGAVHCCEPDRRRVGPLGTESRDRGEGPGAGRCGGGRVRPWHGRGLARPAGGRAATRGRVAGAGAAGLALLVVLAALNGNIFVAPRVVFGLAREGLGPGGLGRVNRGGTPWVAMLLVGAVAVALAATGTFEKLLGLAIAEVLVIDGLTVAALFPLRAREPRAPFSMPGYPAVPVLFIGVYLVLFAWTAVGQSQSVLVALAVLALAYGLSWVARSGQGASAP